MRPQYAYNDLPWTYLDSEPRAEKKYVGEKSQDAIT